MMLNIISVEYKNIIDIHKNFKPFPDVIKNLKELKAKGYKLFLMSNTIHSIMKCNLNSLENVFDGVFTAEDTKCYKPNLKFFEYVEKHIGFDRSEHCHIAKGYWWDIVPCSKLGWRKIWVNRQKKKGSNKHKPYLEVTSLNDIQHLLDIQL